MSANTSEIKNLLFDFGGVIIDIDYNRVKKAFEDLGMEDVRAFYQHDDHSRLVEDFEKGLITEDQFRNAIIAEMPGNISYQDFDDAWNRILLTVPPQRVEMLEKLQKKYNLYLLSNTNIIHYRKYTEDFQKQYGKSLNSLFTKAYYSHEILLRKPNPEIFNFVLKDAGIVASETLFVDDSELNIEAAEKVGLKTLYKSQHNEVADYFK
ncbi:MAG TPA: HAD family phosphatase [Bacteroidales bacterium]|nr:HAD family phosphatase [Bacteroidales bacterium]